MVPLIELRGAMVYAVGVGLPEIPALILCGYVLYKDRLEPEPVGLLVLLFGAGVVCGAGGFFAQKLCLYLCQHYAVLPAECLRAKGAGEDRRFVGSRSVSAPFALGAKTENCVCG